MSISAVNCGILTYGSLENGLLKRPLEDLLANMIGLIFFLDYTQKSQTKETELYVGVTN